MGYYLNPSGTPLASIGGWRDVREWSHGLDEHAHGEVLHFVQHGWSDNVPLLKEQLRSGMAMHPPRGSLEKTLKTLIDNAQGELVAVTDGMGA